MHTKGHLIQFLLSLRRLQDVTGLVCIIRLISETVVILSLTDDDFAQLVSGKKKAQTLFMSGKLKIKGDVMKATKMEPVLKRAQTSAKL